MTRTAALGKVSAPPEQRKAMLPGPGYVIDNRYEIVRELGIGGMGIVYEVTGLMLENRFAMKLLKPDLAQHEMIRERFWREARLQSAIDHPNVTRVYDVVSVEGVPAIIMELLDGVNLADFLDSGEILSSEQVTQLALEITRGLDAAHAQGCVHRDLKPDNIFLVPNKGGGWTPKILDFGVAKIHDAGKLTVTDAFVGTYRYASPEQILESTRVDARSDLYSLGVVLWELVAGQIPYADQSGQYAIQSAVLNDDLAPLPATTSSILDVVIRKLLFKEPELRYQSAAGVIAALSGQYDEENDRNVAMSRQLVDPPEIVDLVPEDKPTAHPLDAAVPTLDSDMIQAAVLALKTNYATEVRNDSMAGDFRHSTAAFEAVIDKSRAKVLGGILLVVVAGVIFALAIQFMRSNIAEIDAATQEGSGELPIEND